MLKETNTVKRESFSLGKRLRSFLHAFNGLRVLIGEEHNARIHLIAIVVVVAASICFNLSITEWVAITFAIALVIITEIINSALERTSDLISEQQNDKIKKIKDLMAAAVLLSAIVAVVIAGLIFIPKFLS